MRICIVYSSCTGNTRRVAEALGATVGLPCHAVGHAPDPAEYDFLAVGFWVRKGQPDARAQRYMRRIYGKPVFYFGTLGAWPQSTHALRCAQATQALLQENGNTVLDGFLCQGKVNPRVITASQRKGTHPMTPARLARLQEAARHPDEKDLQAAEHSWRCCLEAATAAFHQQGATHAQEK